MGFFFLIRGFSYIWEMICKWWLVRIYVSLLKSIVGIGWFGSQANYIYIKQFLDMQLYIYVYNV